MLRPALALALGPFLSGEALARGYGIWSDPWTLLFPYLFLFILLDRAARRRADDVQVFLLGSAFGFLYSGLYTKAMHDGAALTGLDWVAVAAGPLDWGMLSVLWLHVVEAARPRREATTSWFGTALLGAVAFGAGAVYILKTAWDHYRIQRVLGLEWVVADLILAGLAYLLWRRSRRPGRPAGAPAWVWWLAGGGLWMSGASALGQFGVRFGLPQPAYATMQAAWVLGVALAGWLAWRGRAQVAEVPEKRQRLVLAAAALRLAGAAAFLYLAGPSELSSRAGFWPALTFEVPSRLLFYYAFFTSRLEV